MIHFHRCVRQPRRGAAAVEAAVILPVLLIFIAGIVDIGRLPKYADTLTNAARIGAQYGCTNTTTAADTTSISAMVKAELTNENLTVSGTNPVITITTPTVSSTQFISVQVTYSLSGTSVFTFFPVSSITRTVQMPMMPQ
jgi:Flp pilus assembly protein TadG